ncbi:MAG: hypothetical protein ACHQ1D_04175 [Nitrososphaerales archaeon]
MTHFKDPTIGKIDYNKELFNFLKKIFPDAKAVPKTEYHYKNKSRKEKKLKASVIICPIPKCNYQCIEHQKPLADLFLIHLKKVHDIRPTTEFVKNLRAKIRYVRNHNRIPYTDRFIHVQWEDFFKERAS